MNIFDPPPEPDDEGGSIFLIIRNSIFVWGGIAFYLLGAAWGLGWLG